MESWAPTTFPGAAGMGSEQGSWEIHASSSRPVQLCSVPPPTSASRGPWCFQLLGFSGVLWWETVRPHSFAFGEALAVSHLMSYLPLVLLFPSFKIFIGISCMKSSPRALTQCGCVPLFLFLYCYFSMVWGEGESKRMFTVLHLLGAHRCRFIKQQMV